MLDKQMMTFFIRTPLLALLTLLVAGQLFAQQTPQEYLREQERLKRMLLMKKMDSGIYYMDEGQYTLADEKFKQVLSEIRGVPSDLAFHFGKNSYYLKEYRQSIDWLNKYIQLKGTQGQYYEEAVLLMRKSEAGITAMRNKPAEPDAGEGDQVLSSAYEIDCGPTGKVMCPVCQGDHVIVTKGVFGDQYQTCPYCNDHGILTCEEYNLLIRGELKRKL